MKRKLLALVTAIGALFFMFSSRASADNIKIVSDSTYAPFEFKDSDHVYKGIDVDIIKKVAEISGWDYKMSFPGFDAAVNAVQSGQADALMAGTTVTKEREKVFAFSDTYYDTKIVIATRKKDKITKYSQLKGKTVGVKNGTAAQNFLEKHKDKYDYKIKSFDTGDSMYNSLESAAVDAVMDDKPVAQYAINQGQNLRIEMKGESIGSFAFAVKKGSKYEHLITDFNKALKKMKKDGTYDAIMAKWISNKSSKSTLSTSTGNAKAKAKPVKKNYKIVMDSSFAPFEFQNGSGKYVGIDIDLIKAIAKQQGFSITTENPGFDAALNTVQSSQADAVMAGMSITDERKKIFDFSDPYYTSNTLLAVRKGSKVVSYKDLKGKRWGLKTGLLLILSWKK